VHPMSVSTGATVDTAMRRRTPRRMLPSGIAQYPTLAPSFPSGGRWGNLAEAPACPGRPSPSKFHDWPPTSWVIHQKLQILRPSSQDLIQSTT
jgi:hypothetical protein